MSSSVGFNNIKGTCPCSFILHMDSATQIPTGSIFFLIMYCPVLTLLFTNPKIVLRLFAGRSTPATWTIMAFSFLFPLISVLPDFLLISSYGILSLFITFSFVSLILLPFNTSHGVFLSCRTLQLFTTFSLSEPPFGS